MASAGCAVVGGQVTTRMAGVAAALALGEEGDLPPLPGQPFAEGAELRREVLVREEDARASPDLPLDAATPAPVNGRPAGAAGDADQTRPGEGERADARPQRMKSAPL